MNYINSLLLRLKSYLEKESQETRDMLIIYYNFSIGKSNKKDLKLANKQLKDIFKNLGFGTLLLLPLAPLTIPIIIKLSKKYNIDLIPDWFKKEINQKK